VPTYVVERNLLGLTEKHVATMQVALAEASRRLTASGSPVHYRGTTFLPAQSRWFCLFEASSVDRVKAVNETAQVPFVAINEAIRRPLLPQSGSKVAAFPGRSLRHFQKQGSVKEELKRSGSRVQVELKLMGTEVPK